MRALRGRVLVVGAAPAPGYEDWYASLVRDADSVVAADAGAALCRAAGRACDLCVGDMDSIDAETRAWLEDNGVPLRLYPADKDASDLDLAVDAAREAGAAALDVTAAFHARIDHTIASFGTLVRATDLEPRALEPTFTGYVLAPDGRSALELEEAPGASISLFATDRDTVVSIDGVRYPLDRAPLPRHTSLGLSNRAVARRQRVVVHAGRVLVLVPLDGL